MTAVHDIAKCDQTSERVVAVIGKVAPGIWRAWREDEHPDAASSPLP